MTDAIQLVWLKRDLRLHDHAPLTSAIGRGPVIVLYVYEPELWQSPEYDPSHLVFVNESLAELDDALARLGGRITLRTGSLPEVFERLRSQVPFTDLWSHQETGNRLTYDRDLRVAEWCRERGVNWREIPQHGVVRRLRSRDGWSAKWNRRMNEPETPAPEALRPASLSDHGRLVAPAELDLPPSDKDEAQPGGETAALERLDSFLHDRGVNYRKAMSSPVEGWDACSRISPHLAWGTLSIRRAHQATRERRREVKEARRAGKSIDGRWSGSLQSFAGRLRWHCHFMQKLEDEPSIEFENMNRAYDGLRENEFDEEKFEAWRHGETGYPMVDACMRALHHGGWINFRMRAMLVSFAAYHLWLHWRRPAVWLAQHFLDFEPGIHFSQFQMQSGTTGINSLRIYSPAKQAADQDPEGAFIRRWAPELSGVPDEHLPEPHRMAELDQRMAGCVIGRDYPAPIVDHREAYAAARSRMGRARGTKEAREEARRVYQRHGSRRRPAERK